MPITLTLALVLLGGWTASRIFETARLPGILGMILFGTALGFSKDGMIPAVLWDMEPLLKSFALTVILLRAGLGLSRSVLAKAGKTAFLLTFLPCLMEGAALTGLLRLIFRFDWAVSGLCAFMIAAVSPAVIVPSMLDLSSRGYGTKRGVPSVILAGASADDVFAISLFSLFFGPASGHGAALGRTLLQIPLSLGGGIGLGLLSGAGLATLFSLLAKRIGTAEKVLILLACSLILLHFGEKMQVAALLGVMITGLVLREKTGPDAYALGERLKTIWLFAEIFLFVLIGMTVDPSAALGVGVKGLALISGGLLFRSGGVFLATRGSGFTRKETLFCMIAYTPKATVQAALGAAALRKGIPGGETVLALAVLSILFTAPLGLTGIRLLGRRLLAREEDPPGLPESRSESDGLRREG